MLVGAERDFGFLGGRRERVEFVEQRLPVAVEFAVVNSGHAFAPGSSLKSNSIEA
jgi:hypothetical protein